MRRLEAEVGGVAYDRAEDKAREVAHCFGLLVDLFLVKAQDPLEPLKEEDWAGLVELEV